jgi:hypothetical protein
LFSEVMEKLERSEIPGTPQEDWAATSEPLLR